MEREKSIRNDATSKETVDDLEENESLVDEPDGSLPSPDGALEPDEQKDADPF